MYFCIFIYRLCIFDFLYFSSTYYIHVVLYCYIRYYNMIIINTILLVLLEKYFAFAVCIGVLPFSEEQFNKRECNTIHNNNIIVLTWLHGNFLVRRFPVGLALPRVRWYVVQIFRSTGFVGTTPRHNNIALQ